MPRLQLLLLATFCGTFLPAQGTVPDPRVQHFESRVRPLLISRCEECHSEKPEAGLRVDSLASLLRGGDSGPAILPGDPDHSLLIRSVRHEAGVSKMPRKRTKLTAEEVEALAAWIRDGAVWPEGSTTAAEAIEGRITAMRSFWSFQPLGAPPKPAVQHGDWPRVEFDHHVLARLEQHGLQPVAAASPHDWLRRVSFDLTGLPPTADEMDAFVKEPSETARKAVIDRLIASPAYGEHMARFWLDIARYGEDDCRSLAPDHSGLAAYPEAFRYRDWVIDALQRDLPFDQFLIAQLAADQLPEPERTRHLPALGFLGLGPWYYDNGSVEVTHADERHDRVDAVTRGMLGVTVACARCHDHKTDPFSSRDYYGLAGVFLNTRYHEYPLVPKATVEQWENDKERVRRMEQLLDDATQKAKQHFAELLCWQAAEYLMGTYEVLGSQRHEAGLVAANRKLDLELLDRFVRFVQKPPVHYPNLKDWQKLIADKGDEKRAKELAKKFQQQLVDVMLAMRYAERQNEIIVAKSRPDNKPRRPADRPDEFITNDDFCPGCGLELVTLPKEEAALWTDVFERDLDDKYKGQTTIYQSRPGLLEFRGAALERRLSSAERDGLDKLRDALKAAEKQLGEQYARVHGVDDQPQRTTIRVHLRGSPFQLGDEVHSCFPAVLQPAELAGQPFQNGSGRLDLAQRIAAHPLSSRVICNRIWRQMFGTGLVDTPSNFGPVGGAPSHPDLLEYLAEFFVAHGRSIQALQREIASSATYALACADDPLAERQDSGHRLRWRADRRRLTAEQLRDAMLAVAGTLERHRFGPSAPLSTTNRRRTIYGKISRYALDPYLAMFDLPTPTQSNEQRFTTNVPTQRLYLLNSEFVQEQAERIASSTADCRDDRERIEQIYRRVLQRPPTEAEVQAGLTFLRDEPMRSYLDAKARRQEQQQAEQPAGEKSAAENRGDAKPTGKIVEPVVVEPLDPETGGKAGKTDEEVGDKGGDKDGDKKPSAEDKERRPLPVTVLGGYVKVLLCSNEFLYLP